MRVRELRARSIHGQERARPYNCRARRHCYGQSILRHRTRASRSFKPATFAERLRCVGDSSGNENGSGQMKDWEIIADNLDSRIELGLHHKSGFRSGAIVVVDAHRDRKRFVVSGKVISSNLNTFGSTPLFSTKPTKGLIRPCLEAT